MKKTSFYGLVQSCCTFLFLATLTLISACSSDDINPFVIRPEQKEIIEKGLTFPYTGSQQTFPVETTDGAEWTFKQDDASRSWLELQPTTGGLYISCLENTGISPRETVISIVSGSHNISLKVWQEARPMVKTEWNDRLIPKEGETVDIPFSGNTRFTVNLALIYGDHLEQSFEPVRIDSTGVGKGVMHYKIGPNTGLGRVFMLDLHAGGKTVDRVFIRQGFDNKRLRGNVEVDMPDYYAFSETFRKKGMLYTFLGEDNFEGWRQIKTLRLSGNLSVRDLDFLSKLVGSESTAVAPNKMEGAHINLDMNWVTGIDEIPRYQFQKAVALDSVALPFSLQTIGDHAFAGCRNLKHVSLRGTDIKNVESFAFYHCTQLTDLKDDESAIQRIGRYAFATKSALDEFHMPWELKDFVKDSFRDFLARKIHAPWTNADELPDVTFFDPVYESSQLIVPSGSIDIYKHSAAWGRFKHIVEDTGL